MLESIKPLRDKSYSPGFKGAQTLEMVADAIEKEISERYMKLPVDADGIPWHVGDVTENGNTINAICFDHYGCHFSNTRNDIDPSIHRHAKPKTLEDVLCNMIDRFCLTNETKTEVASKCAKEIREMIGGEL